MRVVSPLSSAAQIEKCWVLQTGVWDWVLNHLLFLLWVLIPRVLFVLLCLVFLNLGIVELHGTI